ncbi:DUF6144 family protein [Desulfobacter vibrioformis]|uniref:DUF6144 family protein n=1 Tax=Desulfobacter vibrioformis TaxID=34031 RepID=UPI000552E0D7|nr:DUF6144 family protein [Desulfobacter vibrioformis]
MINKNQKWIESLHEGISLLNETDQETLMKKAGISCVSDILQLCESSLGHEIKTISDLINGWNILRKSKGLKGGWQSNDLEITGVFHECGCPLVRGKYVKLHPIQCLCSKGMIETIFSKVSQTNVKVEMKQSIGNGDNMCEFKVILNGSSFSEKSGS